MATNRANVSVTDLMEVLKKSGLPIGGTPLEQTPLYQKMRAEEAIGGAARSMMPGVSNKPIEDAKANYMKNIMRIAQADQKLGLAFSDPNSPLYMENPLDREKTAARTLNVGYKEAGRLSNEVTGAKKQVTVEEDAQERAISSIVDQSIDLYDKLKKKPKGKGGSKSEFTRKDVNAFTKETGLDVTQKAQIYDDKARKLFLNTPAAFQKDFTRDVISTPVSKVTKNGKRQVPQSQGFTKAQVEKALREWQALKSEISKPTGGTSGTFRY